MSVKAKECESSSVEQGPELPLGGRSGRSTSKKVVPDDDLLWRAGSAASTAARPSAENRGSRGRGAAAAEWQSRAAARQRRSKREAGDADMATTCFVGGAWERKRNGRRCCICMREGCGFKTPARELFINSSEANNTHRYLLVVVVGGMNKVYVVVSAV